jgi:hypothetical protein
MATIVPTEGLNYLATLVLEGATAPATLYLGLFSDTAAAGTTVPGASATRSAMGGTFSEVATGSTYPGYSAVAMTANTDWGTIGTQTVWGNTVTGAVGTQKSFAAATSASANAKICGYFIATHATAGVVLCYSNFTNEASDVIASLALGDIVRVTPTFGFASLAEV